MAASVLPARDETGYPTNAAIEAELDQIWPGWKMEATTHGPEPRHRGKLGDLDAREGPTCRRLKWLLKVHKMRSIGALKPGMGVAEGTPQAANVPGIVVAPVYVGDSPRLVYRVHVLPGVGYRATDEPPPVRSAVSAPALALKLRRPLPEVRDLLARCPEGADPMTWIAAQPGGAQ